MLYDGRLIILSFVLASHTVRSDDHNVPHDASSWDSSLGTILFLSISFLVGALTRHAIKKFSPTFPYTVALLAIGMPFGFIFKYYKEHMRGYYGMIQIDPHLLMYSFLPVLLFESAFLLDIHAIKKSIGQILVLAVPGYILSSLLTAVVVMYLFSYNWSWDVSMMIGAILSATDPVAVVALLKNSPGGRDVHHLSIVIEGESLLNDGAAIVLFNIFQNNAMAPCQDMNYSCSINHTTVEFTSENFCENYLDCDEVLPLHTQMCSTMTETSIIVDIVLKTVGGPLFGVLMGYVIVYWLGKVFNDYLTEITITVGSPYLIYFVSEMFLKSSGVLSVVLFGCVLNMNKMNISPEIETFLNKFWEQMGFLVNTIIFLVVGMIITYSALDNIEPTDIVYLFALYLGVSVSRSIMLMIFHIVLSKIGYGSTWQSASILMWGALRGAVSLALALQVMHNSGFCLAMRSKILFFVSGIVVLTLLINSTTFNKVLSILGFCHISKAKRLAVDSATRDIMESMEKEMEILQGDDTHTDSNWEEVKKVCTIDTIHKVKSDQEDDREAIEKLHGTLTSCDQCESQVPVPLTKAELSEFFDESRNRVFKAFKISLWKQFDSGLLSKPALRFLDDMCDQTLDVRDKFIEFKDISSTWKTGRVLNYMKAFLEAWQKGRKQEEYPIPNNIHQYKIYKLVSSNVFEAIIMILIFINVVVVIVELTMSDKTCESVTNALTGKVTQRKTSLSLAFGYVNYAFNTLFIVEMILKLIGQRKYYFYHKWNVLDFAIIIISLADSISDVFTSCNRTNFNFNVFRIIRIVRLFRCVRLIKWVLLALQKLIREAINKSVSSGYDVGVAYIMASDEVLEHLDHIVAYQECRETFREKIQSTRDQVSSSLGEVRKEFHGIAIAISTRQVTRLILNKGRATAWQLLDDGLVEDFDCALFTKQLEEKMKRLLANPSHWISPPDPYIMFSKAPWLKSVKDYIVYNVAKMSQHQMYNKGETFLKRGEIAKGVYLIVSGRAKVLHSLEDLHRTPSHDLHKTHSIQLACHHKPNDSLGPGQIVGEQSILVNRPRGSFVVCESDLQCYFISAEDMHCLMLRYPIIEENLWRLCSVRIAQSLLLKSKKYKTKKFEELRTICEHSVLATLVPETNNGVFEVDDIITDVVVIYGETRCFPSNSMVMGPKLIPDGSTKLSLATPCKLLIIINQDEDINIPQYKDNKDEPLINREESKRSLLRPGSYADLEAGVISDQSLTLQNELKLSTVINCDPNPKTRQEYEKKRRLSHLKDIREASAEVVVNHGRNNSDSRLTPIEMVPIEKKDE